MFTTIRSLLQVSTFLIVLLSFSWICTGIEFAAIGLPHFMQDEIKNVQTYISNKLSRGMKLQPTPGKNLHITLKTIAPLSKKEFPKVKKILKAVAAQQRPFNIKSAFKGSHINFTKDGLVLLYLAPHKELTHLAYKIYQALHVAKRKKLIKHLDSRIDFPYGAHITIGKLTNRKSTSGHQHTLSSMKHKFKSKINKNFTVDRIVLFHSNKPKSPRIYYNKGTFHFSKNKKQAHKMKKPLKLKQPYYMYFMY